MSQETLVIVGSGWAAFPLTQHVDLSRYAVKVISPMRTLQYTPLLASAACGLFDFRLAEEPVRRQHRTSLEYYHATAEDVDLEQRIVICRPNVDELSEGRSSFEVAYDKLVLAPGCDIQTFGTPGAMEHSLFLRNTRDARRLQRRLLKMLDAASLPGLTDQEQRDILHIRIVGGGAVGIEATAELYDLWNESMRFLYAHLDGKVQISIHDVAPELLSGFDSSLAEYAMQSLKAKKVDIQTSSHIEKVELNAIYTKEDGRLPYGMLLWATGNAPNPLLEKLDVKKPEKGIPRILTDKYLKALRPDGSPIQNVFAIGDAADIEGYSLPMLAEAALQKGEYLVKELNKPGEKPHTPFLYRNRGHMAYLGGSDGVVGGRMEYTGQAAWAAWRSGSLGWTRSWRRKITIAFSWLVILLMGRDIARP